MKISLLLCFLLSFLVVFPQPVDFNNYTPLVCQGKIPDDFRMELEQLLKESTQGGTGAGKKESAQENEFAGRSNYRLSNILYSGKVLYGDVLTEYVNKVADIVLKHEPELRKQLRFYVLKRSDLNAMSTHPGVIFINVGMLAQLETEAQLAFVICHEAVHFKKRHGLERYRQQQTLTERKYRNVNSYDKLKLTLNYSKENELEADREGLEIFLGSPYNTNDANTLLDVSLYSYLPFDDIPLKLNYFQVGSAYKMPKDYFLPNVRPIQASADVPDSMSTHPNVQKRRSAMRRLLELKKPEPGSSFVLPKTEFENMQRIAQCELGISYLVEAEYGEAFYAGYLLEKKYGRNMFTDKLICAALYAVARQKTEFEARKGGEARSRSVNDVREDFIHWSVIQGESQNIYYFFNRVPARELCVLAAVKSYQCFTLYNDSFFARRFDHMAGELVDVYGLSMSRFAEGLTKDSLASGDSKLGRIRKSESASVPYYLCAFNTFYHDPLFSKVFYAKEEDKQKRDQLKASIQYLAYTKEKDETLSKYGEGLDIDTFVMVNPYYYNLVNRYIYLDTVYLVYRINNPGLAPSDEIAIEKNLGLFISQYSSQLNLETRLVGNNNPRNIETEDFNDYQQMMTWAYERAGLGKIDACIYNDQFIGNYAERYGYMGFFYVANVYKTLEIYFVLFDLKTGKVSLVYEKELRKAKADGVQVRMAIYDILHRIKQEPDKINELKKKYGVED